MASPCSPLGQPFLLRRDTAQACRSKRKRQNRIDRIDNNGEEINKLILISEMGVVCV